MILGHVIALDPTAEQEDHFRRACGVARFAYNWGLAEWQRMYEAGEKPTAAKIKANWNAVRKMRFPWSYEVTKCASAQAIKDLGAAFANFFRDLKKPKEERRFGYPRFKSKRSDNGFALWNDQFKIKGSCIRIPALGWVRMHEALRFQGKIMGARIARLGTRWHVSVQVDVDALEKAPASQEAVGVDLGITTLMQLSRPLPDGRTEIDNPRPRSTHMNRQRRLARRISGQDRQRRETGAKTSRRQWRRLRAQRKLHRRIANVRNDAIHKATTAIAAAFQTVVVEDLNVSGMAKNHSLAGAVLDASFREIRRQLEYKTAMRGGRLVVADRFFPSSKTCSACGHVLDSLPLGTRTWCCPKCGARHDRDANAARNLELMVGMARPEPPGQIASATHGEMGALAASERSAVKLPSVNRELNRCAHLRTN